MVSLDLTQELQWCLEGTAETDPIAENGTAWRFGIDARDIDNDFPTEVKEWNLKYKSGQRNPYDTELIASGVIANGISYVPTNGAALYWIMGQSSTAGDPEIHTLTNIDTGNKPTLTIRGESYGATVNKYFSAVGCKVSSVSGNINLSGGYPFLTEAITYDGIKIIDPPTFDGHVPSFHPTDDGLITGTERKGRYSRDANAVFTWHAVDYLPYLMNFNYMIRNDHWLGGINNQAELEYIDEKEEYYFGFGFDVLRGADQTVLTDYEAETQDSLTIKLYNGATTYRQLAFTTCSLISCKKNVATGDTPRSYRVMGVAEDCTATTVDLIDKTVFYGD
jgi:hypothetical protein